MAWFQILLHFKLSETYTFTHLSTDNEWEGCDYEKKNNFETLRLNTWLEGLLWPQSLLYMHYLKCTS